MWAWGEENLKPTRLFLSSSHFSTFDRGIRTQRRPVCLRVTCLEGSAETEAEARRCRAKQTLLWAQQAPGGRVVLRSCQPPQALLWLCRNASHQAPTLLLQVPSNFSCTLESSGSCKTAWCRGPTPRGAEFVGLGTALALELKSPPGDSGRNPCLLTGISLSTWWRAPPWAPRTHSGPCPRGLSPTGQLLF